MDNISAKNTYLVLGKPVKHSRSPFIHQAFAAQTQQSLTYATKQLEADEFDGFVRAFFASNLDAKRGLNVTLPYKERAYALAQYPTPRAQVAQAANTLWRDEAGQICADNTDGLGLVADIINNLHGTLKHKHLLILGAGGAVRGVLQPLLQQAPQRLVITNRTHAKAQALAQHMQPYGNILAQPIDKLDGPAFDWVINGTSASLSGTMPTLPSGLVNRHTSTYDMMYSAQTTVFNQWAQAQGAVHTYDGLGMLVEQAAAAFALWRGVKPDTAQVIDALRKVIKEG